MLPLRCMLCQIPAAKNDALIGRPRVAEVPWAVRQKGSKVINLVIELRKVDRIDQHWVHGNKPSMGIAKRRRCAGQGRGSGEGQRQPTRQDGHWWGLDLRWWQIWPNLRSSQIWGGDKFDQPSLQVPMELDESSARQGSEHADEVIPTLLYLWISFNSILSFLWISFSSFLSHLISCC